MTISQLALTHVRNIQHCNILLDAKCNLFFGRNGSGKTSVLEGIGLIGTGSSFRDREIKKVITYGRDEMILFAKLKNEISIGLKRTVSGEVMLRVNEQNCHTFLVLPKILPIQVFSPDLAVLFFSASKMRRQFLDWILFHVEPEFLEQWRRYQQTLRQRNLALKRRLPINQVKTWDQQLLQAGEYITERRREILAQLRGVINENLSFFLPEYPHFSIDYSQGWSGDLPFEEALFQSITKDLKYQTTQIGPHKADLIFTIGTQKVVDFCSRGEKKAFGYALMLARTEVLRGRVEKPLLYLIDDLSAELDESKLCLLLDRIQHGEHQICITTQNKQDSQIIHERTGGALFHVEQGKIERLL